MCEKNQTVAARQVNIKWSEIQQFIETKLKLGGIDLNKEITKWCLWEDDAITFCYSQKGDAELLPAVKEQREVESKRPAYLKGR